MPLQHRISKSDLRDTKWIDTPDTPLADGNVRLRLDAFALTANNVTYAAFGGAPMNYWQFFPTGEDSFGRVPVWGFATVTASTVDAVPEGKRVYGYFPISAELDVTPVKVGPSGFMDGAPHREGLAPIYNTYSFTDTDPAYEDGREPEQMLFRPLYATGWWLADTLTEAETVPKTVALSSASSKTALALAHSLKTRGGVETIGLTSPRNRDFVEASGLYDTTVTYDDIPGIKADGPSAYVDFMGSAKTNQAIHTALGNGLVRSLVVGVTEWDGDKTPAPLPGPTPEFFFVPDVAAARVKAVGPSILQDMVEDLRAFYGASSAFVVPEVSAGQEAIDTVWQASLNGDVPAKTGHILSL